MAINANASIVGTSNGSGGFNYKVTLNDTGSTSVGAFWFGWIPGEDFLTQDPTAIGSPSEWNAQVVPIGSGFSIEWQANSSASYIPSGGSNASFTFTSTETPAQLGANSTLDSRFPATTSFVYQTGALQTSGLQITPAVTPAVEAATATLSPLETTPGNFQYTIALTDTGNTTVGTFWFAWDDVPDQDFMSVQPANVGSPTGWGDVVTSHDYPGGGIGYGVLWTANSPSADLNPNDVISSFTFDSSETPAQFAATQQFNDSRFGTDFQTTSSFVYSGGPEATPGGNLIVAVECFRAGTRIRTVLGDQPIETLSRGDRIITASGEVRDVIWTGRRHVPCDLHPDPKLTWPVRVARGAIAPSIPSADLWLSRGHALFIDGVLIPVKHLINGTTIALMPVPEVTWHHLELATHDVILAENMPAESYLDIGGRAAFEAQGDVILLHPERTTTTYVSLVHEAASHFPLVVTGPILSAIRRRLADRAAEVPADTSDARAA